MAGFWTQEYIKPLDETPASDIPSGAGGVYFEITDKKTGETTKVPYGESIKYGLDASHLGSTKTPLYKTSSGWSVSEPVTASVSIDEKTGNTVVRGNLDVVSNEDFQSMWKDELDNLSAAYKAGGMNAKMIRTKEGTDGEQETITVAERLAELNTPVATGKGDDKTKVSPLEASAKYYYNMVQREGALGKTFRQIDQNGNVKIIDFNETDMIRLGQNGTGEGTNDSTRISIPKGISGLEKVYKHSGWDEESETISIKDFKDAFYDLDKSGEAAIQNVYSDLERYITERAANPTNSESVDKAKLTGAIALYTYMRHNSPACNFWTGAAYTITAPVKGLMNMSANWGIELATVATSIIDANVNFAQWLAAKIQGKESEGLATLNLAGEVKDYLTTASKIFGQLDYANADVELATKQLNLDIAEQKQIATQLSDSLAGGSGSFSMNSAADAILGISEGLYKLVALIAVGNAFEAAGKAALSGVATKAGTVSRLLQGGATTAEMGKAAQVLVSMLGAENTAVIFGGLSSIASSRVVGFGFEKVMETIGEGLVQDPERLSEVLANQQLLGEDGLVYLQETLYGNAIGGVVGVSAGEALMKAGETVPGRIISAAVRKKVYGAQAAIADAFDALRVKWGKYKSVEEWINETYKPEKAKVMSEQRKIRDLKKAIASQDGIKIIGREADEIIADLNKLDGLVSEVHKWENALDDYNRKSRLLIKQWQYSDDNPLFKATNENLTELTSQILKAEQGAGLVSAAKKHAGSLFSQETTNYIGASVRVPILQNIAESVTNKKTLEKINSEISHWTEFMAKYEQTATPELLNLVQQYSTNYKTWWNQATDLFMKEGLLDIEDIEAWRASGQWGDNGELYARLQRRTEMDKYLIARNDGKADLKLSRDLGHYGFGSTDDFVDPQLVMAQELRVQADIANRNTLIKVWGDVKGNTTVYTAEQTALKTEVAPRLKVYNKEAKSSIKSIVGDLDTEGYFENAFAKEELGRRIRGLERQNAGIARQVLPDTPVTAAEQQTLITVMPDSQIDDLYGLITNNEPVEEALAGFQSSKWGKSVRPEIQAEVDLLYNEGSISNNRLTQQNIQLALKNNPDLSASIKRSILATDPRTAAEPYVKELVQATREETFLDGLYTAYNANLEDIVWLEGRQELAKERFMAAGNKVLNDFGETFYAKNTVAREIGDDLAARFGGTQPEVIKQYLMYDALKHNKKQLTDAVEAQARAYFEKFKFADGKSLTAPQAAYLAKRTAKQISAEVDLKFNEARNAVAQLGGDAKVLVDTRKWQSEIYKEANEIGDRLTADNVFLMRNAEGKMETVEIDPLLANIVGTKPIGTEMGGLQKANYLWMRLFRMGTTGINPTSMINQYWRDMGNAWIMGNVNQTIKQSQRIMSEVFGEDIGATLAQYSEEAQENFLKIAKETNQNVEDVIAQSERARGRLVAEAGTETEAMRLYGETREMWYTGEANREGVYTTAHNAINEITDKLGRANEVRETYLRELTYNNSYAKALQQGKSIEQARIYAEYIANNATTNFTRGTTFLTQFQNTIPYLRSAINGTKSFWRLWSLDPVGITCRMIGGMIIPAVAITSMSMNGEENRKVYKNIPEYQKENALPLVFNGQYFSIPLPQELSAFINPFRHAIEGLNGLHEGKSLEIVANDIFAFSPLELGGFTDIDSINMFAPNGNISWPERLTSGFGQLFSQIAPKYMTSAAMAISGYDLYTGKKIDTSKVVYDPETGAQYTMSYTAGAFSTWLASVFGEDMSAAVAQEVLDSIFGDTPQDMLDWLWTLGAGLKEGLETGDGTKLGDAFMEATKNAAYLVTKVNAPNYQDQVDRAWRSAVSQLYALKTETLSGEKWQNYLQESRKATTEKEKQNVAALKANLVNDYQKQVKIAVDNLVNTYSGSLTTARYASIISLMTMENEANENVNAVTRLANQDIYNQHRNAAVQTMIELGFPAYSNSNIWGQYATASDGTVYLQRATPLQLLDMKNLRYNQSNLHEAAIREIIKENEFTRGEMFKEYNAATTKAQKKQAKANWNVKVINAIYPYIKQYGAKQVITSQVADLLEDYIFVDNPYTAQQYLIEVFGGK